MRPLCQRGFSLLEAIIVVAVTLVLTAMAAKGFQSIKNSYELNTATREIASLAQLARGRATGRATRFRVLIDTSDRSFKMQSCTARSTNTCTTWTDDTQSQSGVLPASVSFITSGVSPAPQGSSVTYPTDFTFNSRGLQVNDTGVPVDNRCFYLQGQQVGRIMAVCTTLTGRTVVWRLSGSTWEQQ